MARREAAVLERARRLIEAGASSRGAIAAELRISPSTLRGWIARYGWRAGGAEDVSSAEEPASERWEAARRLFEGGGADTADLAIVLGLPAAGAEAALAARGLVRGEALPELDGPALRRRLRRHVARQIAALDAELGERPRAPDSARVLRDVAGLKRVLDELRDEAGEGADAGARPDLDGLREAIARRYEAFDEAWAAEALPREPAGGGASRPPS